MKKILILLITCILCSCTVPDCIITNDYNEEFIVDIQMGKVKVQKVIPSHCTFSLGIPYKQIDSMTIVNKEGKVDHAYKIRGSYMSYWIERYEPTRCFIKNRLTKEAYASIVEIYATYQSRYEIESKPIPFGLNEGFETYGDLQIHYKVLDDYPISLRREGNQIIIY